MTTSLFILDVAAAMAITLDGHCSQGWGAASCTGILPVVEEPPAQPSKPRRVKKAKSSKQRRDVEAMCFARVAGALGGMYERVLDMRRGVCQNVVKVLGRAGGIPGHLPQNRTPQLSYRALRCLG